MKKILALLLLSVVCLTANSQTHPLRKKVAVVLSGGGAKGFAHIGALKVIERAGIPIDYIVGTSMGSIVGGLYAIGYDARTLDSLVRCQDWKSMLSDQVNVHSLSLEEKKNKDTYLLSRPILRGNSNDLAGGFISGHNLANLFSRLTVGYHDSIDFGNLPIPFACVATDMVDFKEVDIHSGWLSRAMRASMAIPGAFTPVRVDSMVLVDGGLKNNFPVDVARRMGADVVIGVSVQSPLRTVDKLNSSADILMQLLDFNVKNKYDNNVEHTDVPIMVDVKGYSSTSFSAKAIDTLIARGEEAAREQWNKLMALKDSLGLDSTYVPVRLHRPTDGYLPRKVRLLAVDFEGVVRTDRRYIVRKYHLAEGDSVSSEELEQAMTMLRTDLMYASAEYSLRQMPGGYWLRIVAGSRKTNQANLGVRFDSEEMVALQANASFRFYTHVPMDLSVTGRLGKRSSAKVAATFLPTNYRKWSLIYTFNHNDINIYNRGKRDYNVTYNHHSADLSLLNISGKNYEMAVVARWEKYLFDDVLVGRSGVVQTLDNENMYSYHFRFNFNSENSRYFATHGALLEARYGLYTDDFTQYKEHFGVQMVSALWRVAIRLNSHLTLQPTAYGRNVWGRNVPWCLSNLIGGDFAGHYIEQQLPFAGANDIEVTSNSFVAGGLKIQQRVMDNNYIMLRVALGLNSSELRSLYKSALMRGYQLSWAYDSLFGPINANVGWSTVTRSPYVYVNMGYEF